MFRRASAWVLASLLASGCSGGLRPASAPPRAAATASVAAQTSAIAAPDIEEIFRSDAELAAWLPDAERRRLQVLIAVPDGQGGLSRSGYRVDQEYFYPASAVKLCTAFAAYEKLGELADEYGEELTTATTVRFITRPTRGRKVLSTTLRRDVEASLVVSDNDAFNRLLDFVGPEELAERLARRGISSAHITHHLGDASSWLEPSIELFVPGRGAMPVGQRIGFTIPAAPTVSLGRAYRDERGRLVKSPMSFDTKNAIPLRQLQDALVGIVRPELTGNPAAWQFRYRSELVDTLAQRPPGNLEARYKPLDVALRSGAPGSEVRVCGKGGRAYGFAVENAYVTSDKTGRSFFITTTIYSNNNGVMNDDRYEYEAIADPYVTRLGMVLAQRLLAAAPD